MPTKGNPRQAFRFDPDLWTLFSATVDLVEPPVDRSELVRQFVRWYVREKGVKLPDRPSKELIDQAGKQPAGESE